MKEFALTTVDNPYSPFTQFDEWYAYDTEKGYNSCSYLARVCNTSNDISETDESIAIEKAIDEIISFDCFGIYEKVFMEKDENEE